MRPGRRRPPAAASPPSPGRRSRRILPILLVMAGCETAPDFIALGAGGTAAALTGSPLVGYGVGISVRIVTAEGQRYAYRRRQGGTQDEIAAVAGDLAVGDRASWRIGHTVPIGNEGGELVVTRAIVTPIARCKELLFAVVDGEGPGAERDTYKAEVCESEGTWRWATVEPAVDRWGSLH